MNQFSQMADFTPMLFRQKSRGMSGHVSGHQQVSQIPQSTNYIIQFDFELHVADFNAAPADVSAVPNPQKDAELNWLRQHSEETAAYAGQWLLISGANLIAHSQNFAEIRNAIAANGIVSPFVYYVPTEAESSFVIL
jgi:hypothetical protein